MLVGLAEIVHVIRADERQPEVARERDEPDIHDALFFDPLVLHFEEEVALPENVAIGGRRVERFASLFGAQPGGDLPFQAAAQPDQAAGVLGEHRLVDARLVIEPVGVAGRDELDEVVKAFVAFGEQHEVIRRFAGLPAAIVPAAGRDIHFATQDRFDAAFLRFVVKRHGREHVAVFGHRDRRHLQFGHPIEQLADAARAVEQRELGVEVKVDEIVHWMTGADYRLQTTGYRLQALQPACSLQSAVCSLKLTPTRSSPAVSS